MESSSLRSDEPSCGVKGCTEDADPETHDWTTPMCEAHVNSTMRMFGKVPEKIFFGTE
jgi:hypothetical protein